MSTAEHPSVENEKSFTGKRILRFPEGLSYYHSNNISDVFFSLPIHTDEIIDLFQSEGFEIIEGGEFNSDNLLEFCITSSSKNTYDDYARIASMVGIDMPSVIEPTEVPNTTFPIVVKDPEANCGEHKYLLETTEQKIRFLTWALLEPNLVKLLELENSIEVINELFSHVAHGDFTHPLLNSTLVYNWLFEEKITTPGNFDSSLRVVVDALGNIHYSQLNRSIHPKNTKELDIPQLTYSLIADIKCYRHRSEILLTNPESPFYLQAKEFTSNIATGGTPIIFDTFPPHWDDRELLELLGFHRYCPQLTQYLNNTSQTIGQMCRPFTTHVGIDILIRENTFEPVLLEINKGPHLRPEALGLPTDTNAKSSELELIHRMLSSLNN